MSPLHSFFDVEPLLEPLREGNLILTPNQRLASRIKTAYILFQGQKNKKGEVVLETPNVYSLNGWIENCWRQLLLNAHPVVVSQHILTDYQETQLWQQVIESSAMAESLLRPQIISEQAKSAYKLLQEWKLDLNDETIRSSLEVVEDSRCLLNWIDQFEVQCQQQNWLPAIKRISLLIEQFQQNSLPEAGKIYGVGFLDVSPLYQQLLCSAGGSAGEFVRYTAEEKNQKTAIVECDTPLQEMQAAAVWAKQIIKNDPKATVAIVVPDLIQKRNVQQRVLQEIFDPGYNDPLSLLQSREGQESKDRESQETQEYQELATLSVRKDLAVNFSAGSSLLDTPVISAAINLLQLLKTQPIQLNVFETILHSPFYNLTDSDLPFISSMLEKVAGEKNFELTSARFRQLAHHLTENMLPEEGSEFEGALQQLAEKSRPSVINQLRSPSQWLELFQEILQFFHWPGVRRLDSIEYQQVSQWKNVLIEFSCADLLPENQQQTFNQALAALKELLEQCVFQPKTADSPLQVLGLLEATGLQFSHLWIQSMSDKQWPPAPAPHPLLPATLQKKMGMPHSSADRELSYARSLSDLLINSACEAIISYPGLLDELTCQKSRLFQNVPDLTLQQIIGRPLQSMSPLIEIRRRFFEADAVEVYQEDCAPQIDASEMVKGGSQIFTDQSACPFRAFAKHRLHIKAKDEPVLGLNAAERGRLVHRSLELMWKKLGNKSHLLAMSEQERHHLCGEVSTYSVNQIFANKHSRFGARLQSLEIERLNKLLLSWLEVEESRADFNVIETEKIIEQDAFGITIRAQIDRIDELTDGSQLIIDYKTGGVSVNYWWGDRPDQPQLPLYSVLMAQQKDRGGIAFARVNVEESKIIGIADADSPEKSLCWNERIQTTSGQQDWVQMQVHWHNTLAKIAAEFIQGDATVNPKHHPNDNHKTCQYCHLAPVCRVSHREVEIESGESTQ